MLKYLNEKNYPCPKPLENLNGNFVSIYNKRSVVIFEFLQGTHLENPNEEQMKQFIHKIAELHNLTEDYKIPYKEYRWNYDIEFCRNYAIQKARNIGSSVASKKLKWYLEQLLKLDLPQDLPKGICHCDFNFSNVLFKNGSFSALIDFDDANYTFLIFDLISLFEPKIFLFDHKSWKNIDPDENHISLSEAKFHIHEYEKCRRLKPVEKKYMFEVLKLVILIDCLWYFERGKAESFFERKKIECLEILGRKRFYQKLFGLT